MFYKAKLTKITYIETYIMVYRQFQWTKLRSTKLIGITVVVTIFVQFGFFSIVMKNLFWYYETIKFAIHEHRGAINIECNWFSKHRCGITYA